MNLKSLIRIIVAMIIGYLVMVVFITLVQEVIFGGVDYYSSSLIVLFFAGLGTFLSAVIGGFSAFKINKGSNLYPNILMSLMAITETIYLTATGILKGPMWFDIIAVSSLVIGILIGGKLELFFPLKRPMEIS